MFTCWEVHGPSGIGSRPMADSYGRKAGDMNQ
jgi:hypothetical protein